MRGKCPKWIFLSFFLLFSFLRAWEIRSFDVILIPQKDGSFLVKENILVDFGDEMHHGIYREIPTRIEEGGIKIDRRFKVLDVKKDNEKVPYRKWFHRGRLVVKIGDPHRLVSGLNLYQIFYKVRRGVDYFEDHDEIYWNVTGNEWRVPIRSASFKMPYPDGIKPFAVRCFTGRYGERNENCDIQQLENSLIVRSGYLPPLNGMTVAVGFKKGFFKKPGFLAGFFWFLGDNVLFFIPLFVFGFLFWKWKVGGRDPEESVVVRYEPPEGIGPAEAGVIIDERVDVRDISALLLDLARKGYLRILETFSEKFLFFEKREYLIEKLKNPDSSLKSYEVQMFWAIFARGDEVKLSELRKDTGFVSRMNGVRRSLYKYLVKEGYFPARPDNVRGIYRGIGVGIMVVSIAGFPFFQLLTDGGPFGFFKLLPFLLSGFLFMVFAPFMPRKTRKGARAHAEIAGFREFLKRVEEDRIRRMAEENPEVFYDYLPYALALGLEDRWAELFENIELPQPGWYVTYTAPGSFSTQGFLSSLGRSLSALNTAFTSTRSGGGGIGGGGFSGGGGGGGGGGAW